MPSPTRLNSAGTDSLALEKIPVVRKLQTQSIQKGTKWVPLTHVPIKRVLLTLNKGPHDIPVLPPIPQLFLLVCFVLHPLCVRVLWEGFGQGVNGSQGASA